MARTVKRAIGKPGKRGRPVGVVGLGRMGGPLARRLMRAGPSPLMVWDISEAARAPFEKMAKGRKARVLAPPGEMARSCAAILFVVPSSAEVAACLNGRAGVLRNARRGLIVCDLTTSDPARTRRLARRAERAGVGYLDAAMSGGPAGIEAGRLTLMIGGEAALLRRARRHLLPFAENLFHLGPAGSGHAMKLIHNMVLHTMFLATCEGARLAERMGMRVADMIDVFNVSTAYSYASRHRFPNNILSGEWNAMARVYNPHKDVGLALKLARDHGARAELAGRTFAFLEKAVGRGMADEDLSLLYRDFDRIHAARRPARPRTREAGRSRGGRPRR